MSPFKVGIVGATGAVGLELIKCLYDRKFPIDSLHLYASIKSSGSKLSTSYGEITIELFSVESCRLNDFVFLAVSGEFALEYAEKIAADNGPIVIDNSSAFRYMDHIPLVIPEINPHKLIGSKLIANPNCTTAIAAVALWPIHTKYAITKLIISTYQAASGAGAEGMDELLSGTQAKLEGKVVDNKVFVHPLPFNLIPHIDKFQSNNYTKEEMKVIWETKKIFELSDSDIKITCTAVRIPTLRAHSEAISIETAKPISADDVRELLLSAPGVKVVDDPLNNIYPMPLNSSNCYDVEVGRIRDSLVFSPNGIELFVSGDQLLRGAALNAILIAEKIIQLKN